MASSTMTLPRVTNDSRTNSTTINSAPKVLNFGPLTFEGSSGTFSKLSSISKELLQPLKSTPTASRECRSYWDGLGLQQQQECVDSSRNRIFGKKIGWWLAVMVSQRWNDELYRKSVASRMTKTMENGSSR